VCVGDAGYRGDVGAYREYRPPAGLGPVVACVWESDVLLDRTQRVIPDGCVDLVWLGDHLVVVGADTGPVVWAPVGVATCGIRLRPGMAGGVLGLPANEVRDQRVPLSVLWPESAESTEALAAADPATRLRLLTKAVLHRHAEPDPLITAAMRRLVVPEARVATVASDLGVSERQLHRRITAAVGYSPKVLARVARLRRLVGVRAETLADRAYAAGYASQAHMNDEVRRLTGLTPVRFLEDAALTTA
jgi:methylphosphotriester-DNA--protein-cysteine methyltransferase